MEALLKAIYGMNKGSLASRKIQALIDSQRRRPKKLRGYFSEEDILLITYGDSIKRSGELPLQTLRRFAEEHFKDAFSTIHILPFYPYSSDDGFSVTDFYAVDGRLGDWEDIAALGRDFRLAFDFVLNHVSARSRWFARYLDSEEGFEGLAIEVNPRTDLSGVTRPRTLPLLTEVEKGSGEAAHIWTTFSSDQIDINYKSIDILEKMVQVLLFYIGRGADVLRLDAVAYLWKEIGTNCIHLPQAHDMVKLFRWLLDRIAPDAILLTETNVPHAENISYFGNGMDEAQMVYNFSLPPLLLHAFVKENCSTLSGWAKGLAIESDANTFLNMTATHDGIGVRPLEAILPERDVSMLIDVVKNNGGDVSYMDTPNGRPSPYELNITYIDALSTPHSAHDTSHAERFLASQAIALVLPGMPAVYIHSILGSQNWTEGVKLTNRARTINRQSLDLDSLMADLESPQSFRSKVFYPYLGMVKTRRRQPSFHPNADFDIIDTDPRVFTIRRSRGTEEIIALTNVSSESLRIRIPNTRNGAKMRDLLSGNVYSTRSVQMRPYEYLWLSDA